MRLLRYLARLAAIPLLLGGFAAVFAAASPAASAAPLAAQDGWVRIAHLSPEAPAMDMYLYPFGDPAHPTVLKDVGYGDVSAYMALGPGQYTVAMRGFDASRVKPSGAGLEFMVSAKTAYTVAALGPDPGLRVEVLQDQMTTSRGKTLVSGWSRRRSRKTVSLLAMGHRLLAKQLTFSSVTPYTAVSPGVHTVKFATSGEHTTMSLGLTADTVHTIVVLDGPSGLKADELTDAVGTAVMPKGGAATGFGGTAPRPAGDLTPWLLWVAAAALFAAGVIGLGWPRRTAVIHR